MSIIQFWDNRSVVVTESPRTPLCNPSAVVPQLQSNGSVPGLKGEVWHFRDVEICNPPHIKWIWYGYGSIPIDTFLVGWTSSYQLVWCSPGVQGFDTLPYEYGQILTIQKNHWPLGHFCEPWNFATEHVPYHIHMISPIFPRRRVQSAWRAFKAQSPQWGEPLVAQNSALKKIFFIGIMWGKSRPW